MSTYDHEEEEYDHDIRSKIICCGVQLHFYITQRHVQTTFELR